MIRLFAVCVVALLASAPALAQTSETAALEQKPAAAPACLYKSRTYSDGAFVCVQKSLMLKCSADGAQATWSQVEDKDLAGRCTGPRARSATQAQKLAQWHRRNIRREITPPTDTSPRCFNFNGNRYCE